MTTLSLGWTEHPPKEFIGGAVTVGNFDGVHRGHLALLNSTLGHARTLGGPAVVVTFDPQPVAVLFPASRKPPLGTLADRCDRLHAAGADQVIVLRTEPGLLALSPEAFFEDVVCGLAGARALVEGYNFRFGRGRSGDTMTLRELCAGAGIEFEEVGPELDDGEAISSSRIRAAVAGGDVSTAARWLGRDYAITGIVESGARRGRTIGFPTANLGRVETLVPAVGVYAVRAFVDGVAWPAAANVGPNPTFGEDARKIEVHLIGFEGDLYGRAVRVDFIQRLRDTVPFPGIDELVKQLRKDMEMARQVVHENPAKKPV